MEIAFRDLINNLDKTEGYFKSSITFPHAILTKKTFENNINSRGRVKVGHVYDVI